MENKELTCICCPMGCALNIEMENNEIVKISGNTCKRGDTYARAEIVRPVRMVTTIVKVENGKLKISVGNTACLMQSIVFPTLFYKIKTRQFII